MDRQKTRSNKRQSLNCEETNRQNSYNPNKKKPNGMTPEAVDKPRPNLQSNFYSLRRPNTKQQEQPTFMTTPRHPNSKKRSQQTTRRQQQPQPDLQPMPDPRTPGARSTSTVPTQISETAMHNLIFLHNERLTLLEQMQKSQNQLDKNTLEELKRHSEQLAQDKQDILDQKCQINELKQEIGHIRHNLKKEVRTLRDLLMLITKSNLNAEQFVDSNESVWTELASSDDDESDSEDIQDEEQQHRENNGNAFSPTPTSPSFDFQPFHTGHNMNRLKEFQTLHRKKEDDIRSIEELSEESVVQLNTTFGRLTMPSPVTFNTPGSSGYDSDKDANGLRDLRNIAQKAAEVMSRDETIIMDIPRVKPARGKEDCPYCKKSLSSRAYVKKHIKLHCKDSPRVEGADDSNNRRTGRKNVGRKRLN